MSGSCALCRLARAACDKHLAAEPCERCVRLNMADRCFWPTPAKRGRPPRQPPASAQPAVKILPAAPPLEAGGGGGCGAGDHHQGYAASVPPPPEPEAQTAVLKKKKRRRHQEGDDDDEQRVTRDDGGGAGGGPPASDLGSAATALLVNTIVELKADMRAMTAKLAKMEKKKKKQDKDSNNHDDVVVELQRRVAQLEEDNVQLHIQLAHVAASRCGTSNFAVAPPPRPSSSASASNCAQQRLRAGGDNGQLGPEMLWCFPFLGHYAIPPGRFVVDDIHKAIVAMAHGPNKMRHVAFANHQFCSIVGFSMVELLGHQILGVSPRHEKHKLRHALLGAQMGHSESTPCLIQLECKGGNFAKVASRIQFFFGPDAQLQHSVLCVDQVLGVELVPFTVEEASKKEEAEWTLVFQSEARDLGNDGGPPSSLAPPYTSPSTAGDDTSFSDFIYSTTWADSSPIAPNRHT